MADQIRQAIAEYLIHGIKDPKIGFITVTSVKMTPDLQIARIYFTAYGADPEVVTEGLKNSSKEIRHFLAKELNVRYTPHLEFFFDEKLEEANRLEKIFYDLGHNGAR